MFNKKKQVQQNNAFIICPCCGVEFRAVDEPKKTWVAQSKPFTMRGQDAASLARIPQPVPPQINIPAPSPIPGARLETPVAQQNLESNVKVPLAQALVTGAFVGSAVACIAGCAVALFDVPKPLVVIVGLPMLAMLRATYTKWHGGINLADSLLIRIEDYTGIDWNQDGQIGNETVSHPALKIKRGLMLYNGSRGLQLLPGLPEHQVRRMARKTAELRMPGKLPEHLQDNFSGRYLGKPWGIHLNATKATLSELGYIKICGNDTYKLTDAGKDWLLEAVEYA